MTLVSRRSRPVLAAAGLALGLLASPAPAAEVVQLSLEETIQQAGPVFVGTPVRAVSYRARGGTAILTDYQVRVDAPLPGSGLRPGSTLVLTYFGGTVGEVRHGVAGVDNPVTGQRYVLALRKDWKANPGLTPVVGLTQGQLPVFRNPHTGAEWVADEHGTPLRVQGNRIVRDAEGGIATSGVGLGQFFRWLNTNQTRIRTAPAQFPKDQVRRADPAHGADRPAGAIAGWSAKAAQGGDAERDGKITSFGRAQLPISVRGIPTGRDFSGEDARDIGKWNAYGSLFVREAGGAFGEYAFGNGKFEVVGLVNSAELSAYTNALAPTLFPGGWPAGVLGYTIYRQQTSTGIITEADVLLNAQEFQWTLDDEGIYAGSVGSKESFRATMVHELGHMLGLDHDFNDLSIMAYPVKNYRGTSLPFAIDVVELRVNYAGQADKLTNPLTDVGVYLFSNNPSQDNSWSDSAFPASVTPNGAFTLQNVRLENLGTTSATVRTEGGAAGDTSFHHLQFYLVPERKPNDGRSIPLTVLGHQTANLSAAGQTDNNLNESSRALMTVQLQLPQNAPVPAGNYFVAAALNQGDVNGAVDIYPFNNNYAFSRGFIQVASGGTTSLQLSAQEVMGGQQVTLTVNAAPAVPPGGSLVFNLQSSDPNVLPVNPTQITLAAGQTSGSITLTPSRVSTPTTVTITAALGGSSVGSYSQPSPVSLTILSGVTSATLTGDISIPAGKTAKLTLRLNANADRNYAFKLRGTPNKLNLPPTVTVLKGTNEFTFKARSMKVKVNTDVTITATSTDGAITATGTLTLTVPLKIRGLSAPNLAPGQTGNGRLFLSGAAPDGGVVYLVQILDASDRPRTDVTAPAEVTVEAGQSAVDIPITAAATAKKGPYVLKVTSRDSAKDRMAKTAKILNAQ